MEGIKERPSKDNWFDETAQELSRIQRSRGRGQSNIGIGTVYLTHRLNSTYVNTVKIYSSNKVLINNK